MLLIPAMPKAGSLDGNDGNLANYLSLNICIPLFKVAS
jgi:hypothetical protein